MARLGRNRGGYHGERIDIDVVVAGACAAGRTHGWTETRFLAAPPLYALNRRAAGPPSRRIYLSTGIHGDEPAGPLAVAHLLVENRWPADLDLWVCPCLNPTAFPLNQREAASGQDLNRDYLSLATPEIAAHVAWLERQPAFDLTLCLHEDWEAAGFYLYELNPDGRPSPAENAIAAVERCLPIDRSPLIDGRPATGGIIRPSLDSTLRLQWPEAFYLLRHKTQHSFTLETPSDYPLTDRVAALVTATEALLQAV